MVQPSINRITKLVGTTLMITLSSIRNKRINFITDLLVFVVWLFLDLMAFVDSNFLYLVFTPDNKPIGSLKISNFQ